MKNHLVSTTRFFVIVAAVPFAVGIINAFTEGVGFFFFVLGTPILAMILLTGTAVLLARATREARMLDRMRDRAIIALAPPVLFTLLILAAWPLLGAGGYLGTFARLAINQTAYERIIADAQRDRSALWYKRSNGITYSVDVGPPVRVAFNPAGFLDNWSGIIFDPTGRVMEARGFDAVTGDFHASDEITKLFGGDLVGCRHLQGTFYQCSFT